MGTTFPEVDFDKDILGLTELERFLEEENLLNLYAIIEERELKKKMKFFNKASSDNIPNLILLNRFVCIQVEDKDYPRLVIFTKQKPCTINEDNLLNSTNVLSMSGSPTLALYHSLNNVYSPLFNKVRLPIKCSFFNQLLF